MQRSEDFQSIDKIINTFILQNVKEKNKLINRLKKLVDNPLQFVLLGNIEEIIKKIYFIQYLWLRPSGQNTYVLSETQKKLLQFSKIQIFENVSQLISYLKKSTQGNQFYIVIEEMISFSFLKEIDSFEEIKEIAIINENIPQELLQDAKSLKKELSLFEKEEDFFKKRKNSHRHIPNFTKISKELDKNDINTMRFNHVFLTLPSNRQKAFQDFIKLVEKSSQYETDDLQRFKNSYNYKKRDIKKCMRWYGSQTFFYRILNKGIRTLKNPMQSAYLRLPFFDIFFSIKQLYESQRDMEFRRMDEFICYRCYRFTKEEEEYFRTNTNGYIEMQGFISTSLDMDITIGQYYVQNKSCLLEISVKKQNLGGPLDKGFAEISELTEFKEKQILFNTLNMFKILGVEKKKKLYKYWTQQLTQVQILCIKLEYVSMQSISNKVKNQQMLTGLEKEALVNFQYQQSMATRLDHQGNTLSYCGYYKQASNWFEERLKFYGDLPKMNAYQKLDYQKYLYQASLNKMKMKEYEVAIEYQKKCLQVGQYIHKDENNEMYCQVLCSIGLGYTHLLMKKESQEYYTKAKTILQKNNLTDTTTYGLINKGLNILTGQIESPTKLVKRYSNNLKKIENELGRKNNAYVDDLLHSAFYLGQNQEWQKVIFRCEEGIELIQNQNTKMKGSYTHRQFLFLQLQAYSIQISRQNIDYTSKQTMINRYREINNSKEIFKYVFDKYMQNSLRQLQSPMDLIELRAIMQVCDKIENYELEKLVLNQIVKCDFKYKINKKQLKKLIKQGLQITRSMKQIKLQTLNSISELYISSNLTKTQDYKNFHLLLRAHQIQNKQIFDQQYWQLCIQSTFVTPKIYENQINSILQTSDHEKVLVSLVIIQNRCPNNLHASQFLRLIPTTLEKILKLFCSYGTLEKVREFLSRYYEFQSDNDRITKKVLLQKVKQIYKTQYSMKNQNQKNQNFDLKTSSSNRIKKKKLIV